MSGRLRVAVDRDACCGSGNCVRTAPEVFDQDEDLGLVVLRQPEPPESEYAVVREAAYNCPAAAIDLTEP
ncbi:ferredoxin [Catellatospora paridis]|uniref:ferredoxin n=1 Tax=Catellatospora paridis TaxID=1617086 RepID=UPI001E304215|nr:ferredoxin [Catellatospora paridis]